MILPEEIIIKLIDNGTVPYLYNDRLGYLFVTKSILHNCGRMSGDHITEAACRAVCQIYESELIRLKIELCKIYGK